MAFRADLSILSRCVTLKQVAEVIAEAGVRTRTRRTSGVLGFMFVLALTLFPEVGMASVFEKLTGVSGRRGRQTPASSSLRERRERLGAEPFRLMFARLRGAGAAGSPGARWRGLLVTAWDGTFLEVPDTAGNAVFGRVRNQKRPAAFPQVRLAVLVACGTRTLIDAAFDARTVAESALVERMLPALRAGMLLLADRNFTGWLLWCRTAETGAALCWRVPGRLLLPVHQVLPDGSGLAWRTAPSSVRAADLGGRPRRVLVRVITGVITVTDEHGTRRSEPYRLISTLLDPDRRPAGDLVALYAERWQVELAIKSLKSIQRGNRVVLRSKTADGVRQETWAYLITHQILRLTAADSAVQAGADCDRISFATVLQRLRDAVIRTGGRHGAHAELRRLRAATSTDLGPATRRPRRYDRVIKRPVSPWPSKRPGHTPAQHVTYDIETITKINS